MSYFSSIKRLPFFIITVVSLGGLLHGEEIDQASIDLGLLPQDCYMHMYQGSFEKARACTITTTAYCSAAKDCGPMVISETGFSQTLTDSGTYCLATDLVNPLTINGSSITLDMNGHTIFVPANAVGITINAGLNDVRIHNGLLNGQLLGGDGIDVNGAIDVRLEDLTCINFIGNDIFDGDGIFVNAAHNTTINRVQCDVCGMGVECIFDNNTVLSDMIVTRSTAVGFGAIQCFGSNNLLVQRCKSTHSESGRGFVADGCTNVEIFNCIAENNPLIGFQILNSFSVLVVECFALSNDIDGFDILSVTGLIMRACSAENNTGDGFSVEGDVDQAIIIECIANNNAGFGFNNVVAANQFYKNVACGNSAGNYNGVVTAAVLLPDLASAWQNVACTLP